MVASRIYQLTALVSGFIGNWESSNGIFYLILQWLLVVTFRISLAYLTLHKSTIDIKEGTRDSTEKDSQFRHTETRRRTRRVVKQLWHQIEPRKLCHEFTSIIVWPLREKDRLPVWFVFQFLKVTVKEAKVIWIHCQMKNFTEEKSNHEKVLQTVYIQNRKSLWKDVKWLL